MKTWPTSDTHFAHANIIRYSRRLFDDIAEMNRELVRRWNDVVAPRDVVYHLGTFAMRRPSECSSFCKKLRGRKILVRGNHDRKAEFMREVGFDEVFDNIVAEIDGSTRVDEPLSRRHDTRDLKRPAPPAEYDIALRSRHRYEQRQKNELIVPTHECQKRPESGRFSLFYRIEQAAATNGR